LQAVIGDDALDGAEADGEVSLAELLGDDFRRSVWIQEEVAEDLTHRLVGPAVVGFGAGFLGLESGQAAVVKSGQQLIIALAAVAVFLGDGEDVLLQALAFQEHEEAVGQGILGSNGQSAGGAGELVGFGVEMKGGLHRARIREGGDVV
jgi:hypothetical protein